MRITTIYENDMYILLYSAIRLAHVNLRIITVFNLASLLEDLEKNVYKFRLHQTGILVFLKLPTPFIARHITSR